MRLRAVGGRELRGFVHDTAALGVAHAATTIGLIAQVVLITRGLGLKEFGVFSLTVAFVTTVDQFFDLRVEQAAVAFGAARMKTDKRATAGIIQFSYLVDSVTGIAGFVAVVALAPFVAPGLVGGNGTELFILYALTLVLSTVDTTSVSTLRLLDRFGSIATLTIVREAVRIALVAGAILLTDSLTGVIVALVIHDGLFAVAAFALANSAFARWGEGTRLSRPALDAARDDRRPMLRMIFHTNVISYARIVQAQVPTLVLGAFRGPLEVGVFKVAMSAATVVGKLADPATNAVMPRLARLWSDGRRRDVRKLVGQATWVSAPLMLAAGGAIVLAREPLLRIFGGSNAQAGTTILILAVAAQVVNGALFWNAPLLLACRQARIASWVYASSAALLLPLVIVLTRAAGATGTATSVLVAVVYVNLLLTVAALRVVRDGGGEAVRPRADAEPTRA